MDARPKRSKNGCETCRERRVKCNEIKPICNQCDRLGRLCKWFVGERQPVRVSRRGRGPLKSRPHWIPPPIAPVPSESLIVETDMRSNDPSSPESQWSNSAVANTTSDPNENSDEFHADSGSMDLMISHKVMPNFDDLADLGYSHCFSDVSQQVSNYSPIDQYPSLEFLEIGPSPLLSDFHMALPNSLELSPYEHEALHHYQTTYSLYRTTKDPNWSTHKVLLRMGSYEKMIMHLVLAVSLNDYSIRKGHNASSQEAEDHFRIGAQALVNISSTNLESDEVVTMAAYFFLYLYMSKRKSTRAHQLNQLSLSVLNYVTRHDLFSLCISSNSPSSERSQSKNVSSAHHRSLLARIIMWTLDEDVKCSFQGTGGHFARYLSKYESKTKEIYDTSRNALVDHWGTMYPYSQVLDDDHNSTVLEFLWALMPLWQDINDLAQTSDYSSHRLQIEQTFMRLEEKYSSVFRHSSEIVKPRPRLLVNADYDVVLFHALRIYYFRSTVSDLTIDTPSDIEASIDILLTIIQRTFSSRTTDLHDRLQWPLFLAGIETENIIYQDWILLRLTSKGVAEALKSALEARTLAGRRLSMSEVRKLLYNRVDTNALTSREAYLDFMPQTG